MWEILKYGGAILLVLAPLVCLAPSIRKENGWWPFITTISFLPGLIVVWFWFDWFQSDAPGLIVAGLGLGIIASGELLGRNSDRVSWQMLGMLWATIVVVAALIESFYRLC